MPASSVLRVTAQPGPALRVSVTAVVVMAAVLGALPGTLLGSASGTLPWWFAAAVALREVVHLATLPLLRSRGRTSLPEHVMGHTALKALLLGAFVILLSGVQWFGETFGTLAQVLGWALALWGLGLHWWVGLLHLWQVRTLLQQVPPVPRERPTRTESKARAESTTRAGRSRGRAA